MSLVLVRAVPLRTVLVRAVLGPLGGWLVAGWLGLVVGAVAGAATVVAPRAVLAAAVAAPALVAVWTLGEADLDERSIRTFVQARPAAHDLGLAMVVVWVAAAVVVWNQAPPDPTVAAPSWRRRPWWPLVLLVALAAIGALTAID